MCRVQACLNAARGSPIAAGSLHRVHRSDGVGGMEIESPMLESEITMLAKCLGSAGLPATGVPCVYRRTAGWKHGYLPNRRDSAVFAERKKSPQS